MANIQVKRALERIDRDINRVGKHIQLYSGVDAGQAHDVERLAEDIAVTASQIVEIAREQIAKSMGGSYKRPQRLVQKTRKALGFTVP
jgi:hypothetical protein